MKFGFGFLHCWREPDNKNFIANTCFTVVVVHMKDKDLELKLGGFLNFGWILGSCLPPTSVLMLHQANCLLASPHYFTAHRREIGIDLLKQMNIYPKMPNTSFKMV